jgi:peptidyl-prolyl cis-trans isomerase C
VSGTNVLLGIGKGRLLFYLKVSYCSAEFNKKEKTMTQASARHLLVDTEEQCLTLKTQIENGEDFAEVAKEHSNCPSKAQGGDLGSFGRGQMVPEFDEVVFSAALNTVQGPVKTQFGYHLLEVTARSE